MQTQNESKPIPPAEVSLKYMAWNIKEISEEMKKLQPMIDQKLSEIAYVLREINKTLSVKEKAPF